MLLPKCQNFKPSLIWWKDFSGHYVCLTAWTYWNIEFYNWKLSSITQLISQTNCWKISSECELHICVLLLTVFQSNLIFNLTQVLNLHNRHLTNMFVRHKIYISWGWRPQMYDMKCWCVKMSKGTFLNETDSSHKYQEQQFLDKQSFTLTLKKYFFQAFLEVGEIFWTCMWWFLG